MKITCEFGDFDVFAYREPGSKKIDRAVTVESLVKSLGLSLRRLPYGQGIVHVEFDGREAVPIHHLNMWLIAVKTDPTVINRLSLYLTEGMSRDVGFLSYAHIQLQESLTALGAYYTDTGIDAEYPVDEVEDSLYEIFCEFLKAGEYDPLLMKVDGREMEEHEAWGLSILETSASRLIGQFIREKMDPEYILLFLQIQLKEKVWTIGERVQEMAQTFSAPE